MDDENNLVAKVLKFVDDRKLLAPFRTDTDVEATQVLLNNIYDWVFIII